jgi:hypothetical protein
MSRPESVPCPRTTTPRRADHLPIVLRSSWRCPSRLESRGLTASISSSFSFHRRSSSLAARRLRERLPRRTVRRPFWPHTPVAPACGTGRHHWRSVLPALSGWLPLPKARSPLVVLVRPDGLPSYRRSRYNTARHHHSRLCKDSVHWYRGHRLSKARECRVLGYFLVAADLHS